MEEMPTERKESGCKSEAKIQVKIGGEYSNLCREIGYEISSELKGLRIYFPPKFGFFEHGNEQWVSSRAVTCFVGRLNSQQLFKENPTMNP
jgi:hypothetical protein